MTTKNNTTAQLKIDIRAIYAQWSQPSSQIHKVPLQLRIKAQQSGPSVYDPILVSLGPYHHGKPELFRAEQFKYLCLDWCTRGSEANKDRFYNIILNEIDQIRSCYADIPVVNKYDDAALAKMMLLDACFVQSYLEAHIGETTSNSEWHRFLGFSVFSFTSRDIMVLENQIPFFVQKLLINEMYDIVKAEELLQKLFCFFLGPEQLVIPRVNQQPPIHYLEAYRRLRVERSTNVPGQQQNNQPSVSFSQIRLTKLRKYYTHRSVTDLKAKGIHFRPSSTCLYTDIKFQSHALHGLLHLPVHRVSEKKLVQISNMIAYELSTDCRVHAVVLSYANFMKRLIQTPADVKELQEKRILLLHRTANIEQVVHLFKSIDTFGLSESKNIYEDVMHSIGEHCNNKAKTWMADLINGKLHSPWTILALLSATFLLCLTFLQTFYTIHPER